MTARRARVLILTAAVLWSFSGVFARALRVPTPLGLHEPPPHPLQIACFRALFAGLALVPTLRRADIQWHPAVPLTMLAFAAMNGLFVSALALGSAANAILLQYTAPLWVAALGPVLLGDRTPRRALPALALGATGVAVIVVGNWASESPAVVLLALGSGAAYAGVLLGLRAARGAAANWLTVLNHLGAALVLVPFVATLPPPTFGQLGWLVLFGVVQMALPYWLTARALKAATAQDAATLLLVEPVLNPFWAFLLSPATDRPTPAIFVGGGLLLLAVAWQSLATPPAADRPHN